MLQRSLSSSSVFRQKSPISLNKYERFLVPSLIQVRSYTFDAGRSNGGARGGWPRSMVNTGLCVCPQGERMVIERFGKMSDIKSPGLFLAIPMVDRIAYRVDMRESAIMIPPQTTITKDNCSVNVSGCIYIQFVDAEKAAYGNLDPIYAVTQFAQSTMRAAIGEMELDEVLHARAQLNTIIRGAVQEGAIPWGLKILRYEITEVTPDTKMREAMDKQAAAERTRRERVLTAEGSKQEKELESQGYKIMLTNESEGDLISTENAAKATKLQRVLEAEGEAKAIELRAAANARSIHLIAEALNQLGGSEAAKLALAKDYVNMYGEMGAKSNTMIFQDKPADLNGLMAQVATVFKSTMMSKHSDGPLESDGEADHQGAVDDGEEDGENEETKSGAESLSDYEDYDYDDDRK